MRDDTCLRGRDSELVQYTLSDAPKHAPRFETYAVAFYPAMKICHKVED